MLLAISNHIVRKNVRERRKGHFLEVLSSRCKSFNL
jgi:hypothetical protein